MTQLIVFAKFLYAYCTDFIINAANMLNLSYYEINFIVFCLLYPLLTMGLLFLYVVQKIRLKKMITGE